MQANGGSIRTSSHCPSRPAPTPAQAGDSECRLGQSTLHHWPDQLETNCPWRTSFRYGVRQLVAAFRLGDLSPSGRADSAGQVPPLESDDKFIALQTATGAASRVRDCAPLLRIRLGMVSNSAPYTTTGSHRYRLITLDACSAWIFTSQIIRSRRFWRAHLDTATVKGGHAIAC